MSGVSFIAIPTAQRPMELRRAVQSFAEHLARHGRAEPLIVFHTPQRESEQTIVTEALRGTAAAGAVRYVGLAEKLEMARELKRASGISPALLESALFPRGRQPPAVGANRNAVLLWGAGSRFVSTDDDTLADLHAHPDFDPLARMSDTIVVGDPSDYFVPEDADLSRWRLTPGNREPAGGLVGMMESAWAQSSERGYPVSLVYAGLAGDCGWSAPFGFWGQPLGYLLLNTPTLARLTASPGGWARVLESRRLMRATSGLQLARAAPGMSTCFGMDATRELPPFIPVGRGQDILFAGLVEKLQGTPSAWLPLAVAHEPAAARSFHSGELLRAAGALDLCGVYSALFDDIPAGIGLAAAGRRLREIAADDDQFAQALLESRRRLQRRQVESALTRAAQLDLPAYWRTDVQRYCERVIAQVDSAALPWVLDLGCADARTSMAAARQLVGQYGALCEAWPALWQAARARNAEAGEHSHVAGIRVPQALPPTRKQEPALASPYQTWLWRSFLIAPGDSAHVMFRCYRGSGAVSSEFLTRCLSALAQRHEVLRCRYQGTEEGDAILVACAGSIEVAQRAAMGFAERAAARERERTSPIDLTTSMPLRATLVPIAEQQGCWELWLSFHHIAVDGTSEEILWRELAIVEANLGAGRSALHGLPPLRATFSEIARRQRLQLDAVDTAAMQQHWQARLQDAPDESHATYRAASGPRDSAALRIRYAVPADLAVGLRTLARVQHSSVAILFLTAWQAVLARWSGERDVVLIVDQSNRWDEAEEQSIGLFMSPLPLRTNLADDPRFEELLQRNRRGIAEAATWRQIPYERLLKALNLGRRRMNLFGQLFTHLLRTEGRCLQGARLEALELEVEQADYEIGLTVEETVDGFSLVVIGNRALFESTDLVRLAEAVNTGLRAICQDPAAPISSVNWLSHADRLRLAAWNDTRATYPQQTLAALLHEAALLHWNNVALEMKGDFISYGELWQRADALAARLRAAGVGRNERVGLFIDRQASMLEAMLAVLLAGGGYVPLDPAFPRDRLAFMIEDAALRVLLTTRSRVGDAPPVPSQTRVLCVDDPAAVVMPNPHDWCDATPDSLAYVLYTSGSTGRPKGVEITHQSLVNLLWSMAREPGLDRTDVLLALTTISGDISGLELWLPLLVGARIVLAGAEEAADGARLALALAQSGATVLQATPSTWRALLATGWPGDKRLKALVGGEALPLDLAQQLVQLCGEAWNLYGPTETTIWSSVWKIPADVQAVRIGRPIANTKMVVLDEQLRSLPPGVAGQLYIGGAGVARGYHGRPELNAERFIPDPEDGAERLYATGDLARWLPDGLLDFLGRGDDQIKLRGFRLEPGEIESALLRLPGIAQAAVVLHRPSGDGRLVAYLVTRPGDVLPASADIRVRLREWLIDAMLPYHFVQVDQLPLTPNGKTDRRRLALRHVETDEGAGTTDVASMLEASLMAQVGHVLGRAVGLDTDFFEAGGDSLGALQLVARLAEVRTHELTTGELFLHPTARRLAARLEQLGMSSVRSQHLIAMRDSDGPGLLLFVHPIGGHLTPYAKLALGIRSDVPVYGLQATGAEASYGSIEERCAAYVLELTRVWNGPVTLCGYSLGGVLAAEMAIQLRRAGREVPALVLLDAGVPRPLHQGFEKLRFRMSELWRFSWSDRRVWLMDQLSRRLGGARQSESDLGEGRPLIDAAEMRKIEQQALRWHPVPYAGKVLLFVAGRHIRGYSRQPGSLGWDRYCSGLEVVPLPCDHRHIVAEPQVAQIAAIIDDVLVQSAHREPGAFTLVK